MRAATFIALFIIIISLDASAQCDYRVQILLNESVDSNNIFFRIKAEKISGSPTNITAAAWILDSSQKEIMEYKIWDDIPITRQKTSAKYNLALDRGDYAITSKIITECKDQDDLNNIDTRIFQINTFTQNGTKEPKSESYDNTIYSSKIKHTGEFKSTSERAKEIGLIFFLIISIILNIVLIWKR